MIDVQNNKSYPDNNTCLPGTADGSALLVLLEVTDKQNETSHDQIILLVSLIR